MTNYTGGVVNNYDYDAFGNQLKDTTGDTNPWRYCGEYYDTESSNIYLRNRYYNPYSGRFITQDPIRSGLNWYTYCNNNPINRIDPSGLDSFIIYVPDRAGGGEDVNEKQANIVKKQFEKKYGTVCHVYMVTTAKDFKETWNNLGTIGNEKDGYIQVGIDAVEIISHGDVEKDVSKDNYGIGYLIFKKSRMYASRNNEMGDNDIVVSDLSPKAMDYLYFSACNTANQDFKANIVDAFYYHSPNAKTVAGWDGGVAFVFDSKRKYMGFEIEQDYPSVTQTTFEKLKSKGKNPNRTPGKIEKRHEYLLPAC